MAELPVGLKRSRIGAWNESVCRRFDVWENRLTALTFRPFPPIDPTDASVPSRRAAHDDFGQDWAGHRYPMRFSAWLKPVCYRIQKPKEPFRNQTRSQKHCLPRSRRKKTILQLLYFLAI